MEWASGKKGNNTGRDILQDQEERVFKCDGRTADEQDNILHSRFAK